MIDYGDESAKHHVKEFRSSGLAAQPVQWSRLPHRPSQSVHVDPNFLPLNLTCEAHGDVIEHSNYPAIYIFFCPNVITSLFSSLKPFNVLFLSCSFLKRAS